MYFSHLGFVILFVNKSLTSQMNLKSVRWWKDKDKLRSIPFLLVFILKGFLAGGYKCVIIDFFFKICHSWIEFFPVFYIILFTETGRSG